MTNNPRAAATPMMIGKFTCELPSPELELELSLSLSPFDELLGGESAFGEDSLLASEREGGTGGEDFEGEDEEEEEPSSPLS